MVGFDVPRVAFGLHRRYSVCGQEATVTKRDVTKCRRCEADAVLFGYCVEHLARHSKRDRLGRWAKVES